MRHQQARSRDPMALAGRVFTAGALLFTLVIAGVVGLCAYWLLLDRTPPITVHNGETVRVEHLPRGGAVAFIRWHGTVHRSCPAVSRRWLSGNSGGALIPLPEITYPPEVSDAPPGPVDWEVGVEIPEFLAGADRVTYRIVIEFKCNPLQEALMPIRIAPPPVVIDLRRHGVPGGG